MKEETKGVIFAVAAFAAWGFLPVYWKQMAAVPPLEILCHRVVWSCFFLSLVLTVQKRWPEVRALFRNRAALLGLMISSVLVGGNWFVYIWAVNSGRVVETSLGYYINPMISVVLGFLLLGERFSGVQRVAVGFAVTGVTYSLLAYGQLPLFALTLALSFGFYGFTRKKINVAPIPGLFVETLVLFLPAAAYILWRKSSGLSMFLCDGELSLWMAGSGVATSLPLLWFASATRKLNLSSVGIIQYLAPSIAFILGVFVYKEPFSIHTLITFCFIWTGVGIYTISSVQEANRNA